MVNTSVAYNAGNWVITISSLNPLPLGVTRIRTILALKGYGQDPVNMRTSALANISYFLPAGTSQSTPWVAEWSISTHNTVSYTYDLIIDITLPSIANINSIITSCLLKLDLDVSSFSSITYFYVNDHWVKPSTLQ